MNLIKYSIITLFFIGSRLGYAQAYKPRGTQKILPVEVSFSSSELERGLQVGIKNALWEDARDEIINNKHLQYYKVLNLRLGGRLSGGTLPYTYSSVAFYTAFSYQRKRTKGFYVEPSLLGAFKRKLFHKREIEDSSGMLFELLCDVGYDRSTFRDSPWAYFFQMGYQGEFSENRFYHAPKFSLGINYRFHQLKIKRARKYCS